MRDRTATMTLQAPLPVPGELENAYIKLPGSVWALFGLAAFVSLSLSNPWLTALSLLVVPVFISLLWRPGETPVLLFATGFQWLQVTAKVFHANVLGVPIEALSASGSVELATYLGLGGLLVLALGMRLGMRKLKRSRAGAAIFEAERISPERAFILYLFGTGFAALVGTFAWTVAALAQPLLALMVIKWVFFFALGYVVMRRKERYSYFLVAIAIEFISGIGFFSGFKTVLFMALIVLFTVRYDLKPGSIAAALVVLTALFVFGAAWTGIKSEYRDFLRQGSDQQVTLVSRSDQFNKLAELVGNMEGQDILFSMGPLFERVSYVEYFALTLDYVPEYRSHEGGQVWLASIRHVFTPRILFPDKPRLRSDSELTMRYTGLYLASDDDGTSISIGYMGESYVDFGIWGLFFPVFLLGIFWGYMYYFFISKTESALLGFAFATAILLGAYQFEMASIKLLGGIMIRFVILALVVKFMEGRIMDWLYGGMQPAPLRSRPEQASRPVTT